MKLFVTTFHSEIRHALIYLYINCYRSRCIPRLGQVLYTDLYTLGIPSGIIAVTNSSTWVSSTQIVGFSGGSPNALLWSSSAPSGINLNPSGFADSLAYGANGNQQVGCGYSTPTGNNNNQALLWNGTAASAVNLNPSGFTSSVANGTNGSQQVGFAIGTSTGNNRHAFLWNGTAASAVDLNPSGFTFSVAYGTNGSQQVGYGSGTSTGNNTHALLWNGTAASAVDLNPSGFTSSYTYGTNGNLQVGIAYNGMHDHAFVWSGTAASGIDLQSVLPASFTDSYADRISGDQIFGSAEDIAHNAHAIVWTITPEPANLTLIGLGGAIALQHLRWRK